MSTPKTAVVTGASRGLGLEWVRQLLARGYEVTAVSRAGGDALKGLQTLDSKHLKVLQADLSTDEGLIALFSALPHHLNLLVNNADVYLDGDSSFEELDMKEVHLGMDADFEKSRFGTQVVKNCVYMQVRDHFHGEVGCRR